MLGAPATISDITSFNKFTNLLLFFFAVYILNSPNALQKLENLQMFLFSLRKHLHLVITSIFMVQNSKIQISVL